MPEFIRHRERITEYTYGLTFEWDDTPGAGFSFDCDEHGNVDTAALKCELARENLAACLDGTYKVHPTGVTQYVNTDVTPAAIKCSCGREVDLWGFTNTCECGRDYNSSGYLLGPRSQWGEETGESLADILRIP